MPVLFSVISRNDIILVKYATCTGNFIEVTQQVLQKIPEKDDKLTYSHGKFLLHYVKEEGITYLCITDENFERSKAFALLNVVKRRFQQIYGQRALTAIPYAMNNDFAPVLQAEMKASNLNTRSPQFAGPSSLSDQLANMSYGSSASGTSNKSQQVQAQVDDLKKIMVHNIDTLANRGEKLELLIDRTQNLENNAVNFRQQSRNLHNQLYWKNVKMTVIVCAVVGLFVVIIIWMASGSSS